MDKNGRFYEVSKELAAIVGPISSSILGLNFHELAHQFSDERYRLLSGFITAALPWSKQMVQWSVDNCLEWLDVELSAVPIFDDKQRLKEFRGFGILKIQKETREKKMKISILKYQIFRRVNIQLFVRLQSDCVENCIPL